MAQSVREARIAPLTASALPPPRWGGRVGWSPRRPRPASIKVARKPAKRKTSMALRASSPTTAPSRAWVNGLAFDAPQRHVGHRLADLFGAHWAGLRVPVVEPVDHSQDQ